MGGGATSEASLMGGQGDHAPFMVRVKHSAFGVFHVMTEMRKVWFEACYRVLMCDLLLSTLAEHRLTRPISPPCPPLAG